MRYNNKKKQGFGGAAPNKVKSYVEGMVSKHKVQVIHAIGMDLTLYSTYFRHYSVLQPL